MSTSNPQEEHKNRPLLPPQLLPVVVRDPRFLAGRATVGQPASIDVFGTLLQEAVSKYGEAHVEAAPAYYEYGNALFRHAQRRESDALTDRISVGDEGTATSQAAVSKASELRRAAADAAERRANGNTKLTSVEKVDTQPPQENHTETVESAVSPDDDKNDDDGDDDDDVKLSLEMMETAWSILDNEQQSSEATTTAEKGAYSEWIKEQIPRVLTGIGDVLSALHRHADSADAYLRALGHRLDALEAVALQNDNAEQQQQQQQQQQGENNEGSQLLLLQCRRKVVEANILIVEELVACGNDCDVITSESKTVLVKAGSVIDYARGYYDKARDELQEAVLLLGQLAAAHVDTGDEKENICFVATMVMGAGTALMEMDEELAEQEKEPIKKKAKA